jgi:hypothetical protein
MEELLYRLELYIQSHPATAVFKPPASIADIEHVESVLGTSIPEQYRAFLLRHDGGFINIAGNGEDLSGAEWNSHSLLGVLQIVREHTTWSRRGSEIFGIEEPWPFMPFCDTAYQEMLVLDTRVQPATIVDAFHEVPPNDWGVLYPTFAAFLEAYLDGDGKLETVATG